MPVRRLPPNVGHGRPADLLGQVDVVGGYGLSFVESTDAVLDVALVELAVLCARIGEDIDDVEGLLAGDPDGSQFALVAVDLVAAEQPAAGFAVACCHGRLLVSWAGRQPTGGRERGRNPSRRRGPWEPRPVRG